MRKMTLIPLAIGLAVALQPAAHAKFGSGIVLDPTQSAHAIVQIPEHERIVIIEDTSELRIQKPNVLAVECQTDTFKASVTFDDLLKSALRWRPDRIILGEVRGTEARTLLDSFNTGHSGSLATIHANSAVKALRRFANLVMRSHQQATFEDIEAEIGEAVNFIVHVERQPGRRAIREVLRLDGYDRQAQEFRFEMVYDCMDSPINGDLILA